MHSMSSRRLQFGITIPLLVCAMQLIQMSPVGWQTKDFQPLSIDSGSKDIYQNITQNKATQSFEEHDENREWHENSSTVQAVSAALSSDEKRFHQNITQKNAAQSFVETDEEREWHEKSDTVQALEKAVLAALSSDEKRLWFSSPQFESPTIRTSHSHCPKPVKFKRRMMKETNFTLEEKNMLREKLLKGSKTIRNAFMPFIDKGGFHPDLILHSIDAMGLIVGIFDGKVYFGGKSNLKAVPKVKILAEHLESVMAEFRKRKVDIPDVIFPYTVRSLPSNKHTFECAKYSIVPEHLQDRYDTVPVAGIAMDPSIHDGIALFPNMYFGNIRVWNEYTKRLLAKGKADTPWNERRKRVFWRGKVGRKLKANIPRLEALQAAARSAKTKSSKLDIALTAGCSEMKKYTDSVNRTSPESPPWLSRREFWKVSKGCGKSNRVPHAKFTNYWAQLNLPGSAMGSYSKNLQNLWPTGAAVMIWDQAAVEFYYDTLKPGITHVWVNESTIEPMAEKLFENGGELARLMGSVGREWFKKHLTMDAILDYYQQWFHAWAALQRFTPTPDMIPHACTCAGWSDKRKNRCSFCAKYPAIIKKGCHVMMGGRMVKASICR